MAFVATIDGNAAVFMADLIAKKIGPPNYVDSFGPAGSADMTVPDVMKLDIAKVSPTGMSVMVDYASVARPELDVAMRIYKLDPDKLTISPRKFNIVPTFNYYDISLSSGQPHSGLRGSILKVKKPTFGFLDCPTTNKTDLQIIDCMTPKVDLLAQIFNNNLIGENGFIFLLGHNDLYQERILKGGNSEDADYIVGVNSGNFQKNTLASDDKWGKNLCDNCGLGSVLRIHLTDGTVKSLDNPYIKSGNSWNRVRASVDHVSTRSTAFTGYVIVSHHAYASSDAANDERTAFGYDSVTALKADASGTEYGLGQLHRMDTFNGIQIGYYDTEAHCSSDLTGVAVVCNSPWDLNAGNDSFSADKAPSSSDVIEYQSGSSIPKIRSYLYNLQTP